MAFGACEEMLFSQIDGEENVLSVTTERLPVNQQFAALDTLPHC